MQKKISERTYTIALWVMLIICIILNFWKISKGLWWDEFITYWITSPENFSEMITRASQYQGQGALYFIIEWFIIHYISANEIILRIPSALAGIFVIIFFYKFLKIRYSFEIATVGVLFLLTNNIVIETFLWARPYALALMCSSASSLLLLNEPNLARKKHYLLYFSTTILSLFLHPISAIILFGQFVLITGNKNLNKEIKKDWLNCMGIIALIAISIAILKHQSIKENLHLYFDNPALPVKPFFQSVFIPQLIYGSIIYFIMSTVIAIGIAPKQNIIISDKSAKLIKNTLILYFSSALALIAICFLYGKGIYQTRYTVFFLPYSCIFLATLAHELKFFRAQRIATIALGFFVLTISWNTFTAEGTNWKKAFEYTNNSIENEHLKTSILFSPGVSESTSPLWFQDEIKASYLSSPIRYYQLQDTVILIPSSLKNETLKKIAIERITITSLESQKLIWIYGSYDEEKKFYENYKNILNTIKQFHYTQFDTKQFGRVVVTIFQKNL